MTVVEALEYLNLPADSRRQLIRKRYLELKNDYLKAIYNAPSDHFSSLYRENLQKIEEAYCFLIEDSESINDRDSKMQQTILNIQQMVNSFLREGQVLDAASREKLKYYINQIDHLKETLTKESHQSELSQMVTANNQYRPAWQWEVDKLKREDLTSESYQPEVPSVRSANHKYSGVLEHWIKQLFMAPYPETVGARKYLYDRLLMGIIMAIIVAGIMGCIYVIFPLLF